ncbi:MAG: YafY family transcriptional regulator [Pseudomonadales bacterium]|nr:YafY family transcriptional regulator [Pseudomonadales bacterium]
MRRADRLFQLMLLLQEGKVRTARYLGEKLEVSERTIYRDIGDLVGSGIPIDGEAGVGYLLRDDYRVPPLMFTAAELQALALGALMVRAWSDREMAQVTRSAIRKIESVLPERLRAETSLHQIVVPGFQMTARLSDNLVAIRHAINSHLRLDCTYESLGGEVSARRLRPLILYFWGNKWTLGAWCELREAFRSFRVDLLSNVAVTDMAFEPDDKISAEAYVARQR